MRIALMTVLLLLLKTCCAQPGDRTPGVVRTCHELSVAHLPYTDRQLMKLIQVQVYLDELLEGKSSNSHLNPKWNYYRYAFQQLYCSHLQKKNQYSQEQEIKLCSFARTFLELEEIGTWKDHQKQVQQFIQMWFYQQARRAIQENTLPDFLSIKEHYLWYKTNEYEQELLLQQSILEASNNPMVQLNYLTLTGRELDNSIYAIYLSQITTNYVNFVNNLLHNSSSKAPPPN